MVRVRQEPRRCGGGRVRGVARGGSRVFVSLPSCFPPFLAPSVADLACSGPREMDPYEQSAAPSSPTPHNSPSADDEKAAETEDLKSLNTLVEQVTKEITGVGALLASFAQQ